MGDTIGDSIGDSIEVDGIILVLSCRKFAKIRLPELVIPPTTYKTVVVVGDQSIDSAYVLGRSRKTGWYHLTLNCEDTYIHLFKKLVLAIDAIFENFTIREGGGILRICDDVVFDPQFAQSIFIQCSTL